jgi:hypothetical protein
MPLKRKKCGISETTHVHHQQRDAKATRRDEQVITWH